MPQIGWFEIVLIIIVAILVLGPKEFPIAVRKIGNIIGKAKNYFSSFKREISDIDQNIQSDIPKNPIEENKKDKKKDS
jgi:sec-independent protein translocase protein TatB